MESGSNNRCPDELSSESPNKRFKTQNQENSPTRPPSPSPSASNLSSLKGKAKLEPETDSSICGICLSEAIQDGNHSCRGYIDSCDHYFCFVCIMEWAKIETKCPICKRQFSNIRRPSKPPLFPCERLVHVPVRDQADYHFGNASAGPLDLYANVECTMCHSSADESFLLLCDLCDSASHTYCVGLGSNVPEGDWFCGDCTLLRAEHTQSGLDAKSEELRNSGNVNNSPEDVTVSDIVRAPEFPIRTVERSSERTQTEVDTDSNDPSNSGTLNSSPTNATFFDIVRDHESPIRRVERSSEHTQSKLGIKSRKLSTSRNLNSSPKSITAFDIVRGPESPVRRVVRSSTSTLSNDMIGMDNRGRGNNGQDSGRLSARTLQQRHNVLDHIQALRDNWNNFRSGSLKFSSSSCSCSDQNCEVASNSAHLHSASSKHDGLNSENGPLVPTENRSIHEVDKAWKMMHMAKSLEKKFGRKSIPNQASKSPLSSKHLSKNDKLGSVNLASIRKERQTLHHNLMDNSNKHRTQTLENQILPVQTFQNCSTDLQISSTLVCFKSTYPQDTSSPSQNDLGIRYRRSLHTKTEGATKLSAPPNHCSKPVSLSSGASTPVASDLSHAKLEYSASLSCKIELSKRKDRGTKERNPVELEKQGTNDAKSEIQAIVKLNLKLLNKDKNLGVKAFKEVAWSATHSILAACGLEQPRPGIHLFPSCTCCHARDGLDIRRSTLMPNSCRECFYVFVKDVVSTIMLEKLQTADGAGDSLDLATQ